MEIQLRSNKSHYYIISNRIIIFKYICNIINDTSTYYRFNKNSNVDSRLFQTKLKKDLLKELLNYKSSTYKELTEDEILNLYNKITDKLSVINTF